MTSSTTPPGTSPIPAEEQLDWLRLMHEIRFFEEECHRMFAQGIVRGSTHLCQGQEAVSVGACYGARESDTMACTIAATERLSPRARRLIARSAKSSGKADGLCGGKGGSMHLTDMSSVRWARSRSSAPTSRLSSASRWPPSTRSDRVKSVLLRGRVDQHRRLSRGAQSGGDLEAAVIFLCENNLYGEYSPVAARLPSSDSPTAPPPTPCQGSIDGKDVSRARRRRRSGRARAGR